MKYNESVFIEKIKVRKILSIGDLIDVEIPKQHIIGNSRIISLDFSSKIAQILPPIYRNSRLKLFPGETLNMRIYENSSNIVIKSKLLKVEKENILVYLPSIAFKIQKRLFYRIPIIREGLLLDNENNKNIPFETRDFSAGGIQIVLRETLYKEKQYTLKKLLIDKNLFLENIKARVVRFVGDNIYNEKIYGMKFITIDYKIEKKIVQYINLYTIKSKHKDREGKK
ncbi:c-di-GMP-binding flagellar brake protein YcgR, contains PilZNR and PilZ domains [Marinitoga hydrogenitolerans DSM 16785]|uniref:C-di-GMP-binding flagellar brake protein YcgR, contains PilZNR and PilZ domains n=1 Tax=Marinitoga hydrogenitolerans (strain DSM 16785 / JCM 12826 / AT1271) TaxID=1122195 RepID=A0A1M4S5F5_MARH1|nr:PilZ domain-containing protein [Marinitoga hydrogenitolerans]SHE27419.1 c-di-GMP-binding flagellar brake protein YcgR, contains PilZNR and PilZ domains [Marinitoga hydrogenitolerans DSM 16785]